MTIHHQVRGMAGLLAALAAGCSLFSGGTSSSVVKPGEAGTTSNSADDGTLRVHFEVDSSEDLSPDDGLASVATSCGEAAGIHLEISDSAGMAQSCDEIWAPVTVSGDYAGGGSGDHYIADCMFVVSPGTWSIDALEAVDPSGVALSCCDSSFPSSVVVSESVTTEIGGLIQCDTESNGGLDIYATVNTAPQITSISISPSKFGTTCSLITLSAAAYDDQGDAITYSWSVVSAPSGADYSLQGDGSSAYFASASVGDYTLQLTVSDETGASHYLTFPLHIVNDDGGTTCDVESLVGGGDTGDSMDSGCDYDHDGDDDDD